LRLLTIGAATAARRGCFAPPTQNIPTTSRSQLRAGFLWDQFGAEQRTTFLHRTGMLSLGPADSALISGTRASAVAHQLNVENLSRDQILSRFPAFNVPGDWDGVWEPAAGWIDVDAALRAGLQEAARLGADLLLNTCVHEWSWTGDSFVLRISDRTLRARRLILTAGAWTSRILADMTLPVRVLRKVLVWINPLRDEPIPVFASAREFFYGFPNINGHVKLAIHWSGGPAVDPDATQPEPTTDEVRPVLEAAAELLPTIIGALPGALQRVRRTRTCFYAMTPDEHFMIDRHPRTPNLVFAAGFSGHGFKFAPAIGEALADLALTGRSTLPIGFLALHRFV
jgi:sarcosine oxidase